MKEFLDILCSKWSELSDSEKEAVSGLMFTKMSIPVKDRDVIMVKYPLDSEGNSLMDFSLIEVYHNMIKGMFEGCKVLTSPLDIEVISKTE